MSRGFRSRWIRAHKGARYDLLDLDHLAEEDLQRLEDEFQKLSDRASSARASRKQSRAKTKA